MFFMNDDYEIEEFEPTMSMEQHTRTWDISLFVEEVDDDLEIGLKLDAKDEEMELEAIEFFLISMSEGIFYQDLEVENFDGTIQYAELCTFCGEEDEEDGLFSYSHYMPYLSVVINWREAHGFIQTDYVDFDMFNFRERLHGELE